MIELLPPRGRTISDAEAVESPDARWIVVNPSSDLQIVSVRKGKSDEIATNADQDKILTWSVTDALSTRPSPERLIGRAAFLMHLSVHDEDPPTSAAFSHLVALIGACVAYRPDRAQEILSDAFLTATASGEFQLEWERDDDYLEVVVAEDGQFHALGDSLGREWEFDSVNVAPIAMTILLWGADGISILTNA